MTDEERNCGHKEVDLKKSLEKGEKTLHSSKYLGPQTYRNLLLVTLPTDNQTVPREGGKEFIITCLA